MDCKRCGNAIEGRAGNARYCSRACGRAFIAERNMKVAIDNRVLTCQHCGQLFNGARSDQKFCGTKCRRRARFGTPAADPPAVKICEQCSEPYAAGKNGNFRRFCSEKCAHRWGYEHNPNVYQCRQCGKSYAPKQRSRDQFCSRKCTDEFRRANGGIPNDVKRENFGKNHLTRAKKYGVAWERIRTQDILERDGWRCYICGSSTPKELRGTFEDNAPELDHIVPMVAGGGHVKSNVACCCRKCNNDKSGRLGG